MMLRNALLALAVLLCGACARFENPIVAEDGPTLDEALVGRWFTENPDGKFEMEIVRNGNEGRIVATGTEVGEAPKSEELRLVTARLERLSFASVTDVTPDHNWTLIRYELVTPDRLIVFQDNDRFWSDAVKNKLIAGDDDHSGKVQNLRVTASSGELRVIILGYGSVIFEDQPSAEFRRVPANQQH